MERTRIERRQEPLADDLIWGAEAIAAYLGLKPTAIFYAARKGTLPIKRVGEKLVASKVALRRHFQQQED